MKQISTEEDPPHSLCAVDIASEGQTDLGDVDTRPKQLQVFSHLRRLVFGVEDGQLSEHSHVGSLQAQGRLHQRDELVEVATVLVEVDQLFQFVCVDDDVQATDLGQTEFLRLHTGEADLGGREGGRERSKL